eukprot:7123672-Ditylum_brightwellii.AAC.1
MLLQCIDEMFTMFLPLNFYPKVIYHQCKCDWPPFVLPKLWGVLHWQDVISEAHAFIALHWGI